jgi:glycosyltransferase involved in cell wall biosynthesis
MRAMKILLAHNRYLFSGGERQVFEAELGLLRDNGHEVDVYTEDNLRIAELGNLQTATRTIWSRETYRQVKDKLRTGQHDIVHVHNFFPLISPSIYYAAEAENVPVVQTVHNFRLLCINGVLFRDGVVCEDCVGRMFPWPGIINACYKDSHGGSTAVATMLSIHRAIKTWERMVNTYIALTEFSRQKLIEGGLPEKKIAIKPNFISRDPGPGSGKGNFALFVGRLSPEKGIDTMLASWSLLGETVPLKIVGDGPLRDQVITTAKSVSTIEHLGHLDNEQVLSLMQDALFLVFPSLLYENFPMTIIEAFATGLPVLASNLGNTATLIQSRQTGLHFKPGDAADLAKKARWLVDNLDALREMRSTVRETYEEKFTRSSNYRILSDIYQNTLVKFKNGT